MSKTILELSSLYDFIGQGETPNLATNYKSDGVNVEYDDYFGKFCSTQDYIPISHKLQDNLYVTYKLRVDQIDYWLYQLHRDAISAYLSSHLSLGDLAWKDEIELNLQPLSHREHITYKDLSALDDVTIQKGKWDNSIPIQCLNPVPGVLYDMTIQTLSVSELNLKELAHFDEKDLGLKDLAYCSAIYDCHVAEHANISTSKINGLGQLATRDYISLNGLPGQNGGFVGKLSTEYINGLEKYELKVAEDNRLGGIQTKYPTSGGRYGVKVAQNGIYAKSAYVDVPWTDTKFTGLSAKIFSNKVNQVTLSAAYSMLSVQNGGGTQTSDTIIFENTATINPYIKNNVILTSYQNDTNIYDQLENSLAIFKKGSNSTNVLVYPINAKISEGSNEYAFLRKNGSFEVIPKATQSRDGLLSKEDKVIIDNLNSPEKVFYVLPSATPTKLGGVKVFAEQSEKSLQHYNNGEDIVSLPVYKNNDNKLFVNILKDSGKSDAMDAKIDTKVGNAVANIFSQLYPVGAIYLTTSEQCPISALIPGSNWEKIEGRYLLASGQIAGTGSASNERFSAGAAVSAGLPDHSHTISVGLGGCSCKSQTSIHNSHNSSSWYPSIGGPSYSKNVSIATSLTVRPPAYAVNVFRRIA